MKVFESREFQAALDYAVSGGQAIHVHGIIANTAKAPGCFKRAIGRGEAIAHLFDQDEARLVATAKRLGVRVVNVERRGTPKQHIDLCGGPLRKALAEAAV